uniref:Uncharacterized protein LOC114342048 n=1 Tax=Diabrotica virgifera virgifera TaxID=50390 RepID=A0A6P7GG21_DIAVI
MSEALDKLHNFNTADGSVTELQARLNDAKHLIREFEDIQREIEASLDQVSEEEINHYIEFNSLYYSTNLFLDRFENKELLIHNHNKSMFNIKQIKENSSSSLRYLVDTITSNLRSLQSLKEPVDKWDSLLTYIVLEKLDSDTAQDWEKNKTKNCSFQDFKTFLSNKANVLEKIEQSTNHARHSSDKSQCSSHSSNKSSKTHSFVTNQSAIKTFLSNKANVLEKIEQSTNHARHSSDKSQCSSHSSNKSSKTRSFVTNQSAIFSCAFCRGDHKIYTCEEFLKLNVHSRIEEVKKRSLCLNCLHVGHISSTCKYGKCKHCKSKHHSVLHIETSEVSIPSTSHINSQTSLSNYTNVQNKGVLLSTVKVQLFDQHNKAHTCKAILDSGSQSNFVSSNLL